MSREKNRDSEPAEGAPEGEWSGFGILCADRSGTVVCPPEGLGSA